MQDVIFKWTDLFNIRKKQGDDFPCFCLSERRLSFEFSLKLDYNSAENEERNRVYFIQNGIKTPVTERENEMAYIEVKNSSKFYGTGDNQIAANQDVNFEIEKGELVIILGSSGAGKSTLLNILGGMDTNDEGQVVIDGVDIAQFSSHQRTNYRRDDVGFVFQFYNLVANLTAKENVELAAEIVKDAADPVKVLTEAGLGNRLNHFPAQLSGGEQQRVSIARAVAKNPKLLLCDEPTGALDYQTGKQILQILQDMSRHQGATVIIVTHNSALAPIADKVIHMRDATVQTVTINEQPQDIATLEY